MGSGKKYTSHLGLKQRAKPHSTMLALGQVRDSLNTHMCCRRPGQKLSSVVGSSYYVSPEV